jgi:single-stranded-DNA-specific exonuclease
VEAESVPAPKPLQAYIGGHPLIAQILVRRGIHSVEDAKPFLNADAYSPTPASSLQGVDQAVERIQTAIEEGESICVWGDFDVDGQTATTILVSTLRELGAEVWHHIPVRDTESHGIQIPWLQEELDRGARLILSCDTGIDAHEAVAYARTRGIDVIITDHHELPETLPDAAVIINPHLNSPEHPLATLPGAGVAFKLAEALYERWGFPERAANLLDLVALGIVADVARLQGDARYLLQRGLDALRKTSRLGLQELMKRAEIEPDLLDETDIGFGIAPRLNAVGRLADAGVVVEFLTTDDLMQARILASQLESLNNRRRSLCDQHFAEAKQQVHDDPALLERSALVLSDPDWHPGVIGIVANRIAELYQRPTVMISAPPGEIARGSARSVPGCHITEAIATQAELLEGFGGHAMAAGLAIKSEHISSFARGLSRAAEKQLVDAEIQAVVEISGEIPLDALSLDLVTDFEQLAPFGPGNPQPVFMVQNVKVTSTRKLGRSGAHLRVQIEDEDGATVPVFWWGWRGANVPEEPFDLAYRIRRNVFRGSVELQVEWVDGRIQVPAKPAIEAKPLSVEIVARERVVQRLARNADLTIWREGPVEKDPVGTDRYSLDPAETLVIWTLPPSVDELRRVLSKVQPRTVWIVGEDPGTDDPQQFVRRLGGLVKFALSKRKGEVRLETLATAMAHREVTIRIALNWMEARGDVKWEEVWDGIRLSEGREPQVEQQHELIGPLKTSVEETRRYRAYLRADLQRLKGQIEQILEGLNARK